MRQHEAAERFVHWLDERVTAEGRGDEKHTLETSPAGVFWLGRLAPESEAMSEVRKRNRRMDPCSIGMRVRPVAASSWSFSAQVRAVAWNKLAEDKWEKTEPIDVRLPVAARPGDEQRSFGSEELAEAFRRVGGDGLAPQVRVTDESWRGAPELLIELVNATPEEARQRGERHLFQVELEVAGLDTEPFVLESLPDSFRYDRRMDAIGTNCGVIRHPDGRLVTTDTVVVNRRRPEYRFGGTAPGSLDLSFAQLAADPIRRMRDLIAAYEQWGAKHWTAGRLSERAAAEGWKPEMVTQAAQAAEDYREEIERLNRGLVALENDEHLRRAFVLMNIAMARAARGKYDQWRPFQIGFVLSVLPSFASGTRDWDTVETVWFATGGGKTETYLALLVLAAFYDRLRGKLAGITAWSRFPLRMLSLQQTQRFADALGAAELVRRKHRIPGDPISLGYFVGASATPNQVPEKPTEFNPIDIEAGGWETRYLVLSSCPLCGAKDVYTKFHRGNWTLRHLCRNPECPSGGEALPFYIVDAEIYRFLPTVVIGTLDKASLIAMQANMRGYLDGPAGRCSIRSHGYTYAKRTERPSGCLVPGCKAAVKPIRERDRHDFAPSLRLQDELHLLRDSLGAVDSHYESLMDSLQEEIAGTRPKIIASSATLTGYQRQIDVLYQRPGRVFPVQGPSAEESFWSRETNQLLRRFVAVWPRGVTLEWVSDRTLTILQQSVRRLITEPQIVCAEAEVDLEHVQFLLDIYGTNVIYGNTVRDVEAAIRSTGTQVPVTPLNAVSLTGQADFEEVRAALDRLEHPEDEFDERIHVVAASSMMSHGVDINRLNTMTVLGVPLTTAEFIQATARVGRTYPGLVYVIHKIGRERDATVFSHFGPFVRQGDRFVEPIPVTRSSRRVLELTTAAAIEARRLFVHEPRSQGQRLTTVDLLRKYVMENDIKRDDEARAIATALGIPEARHLAYADIMAYLDVYFTRLEDPGFGARFPGELFDRNRKPMLSLRDVEAQVPVTDDYDQKARR
jgi:hypothetical protein